MRDGLSGVLQPSAGKYRSSHDGSDDYPRDLLVTPVAVLTVVIARLVRLTVGVHVPIAGVNMAFDLSNREQACPTRYSVF